MNFDATISEPLQQPQTGLFMVTIKIGHMKVKRAFVNNLKH